MELMWFDEDVPIFKSHAHENSYESLIHDRHPGEIKIQKSGPRRQIDHVCDSQKKNRGRRFNEKVIKHL